MRRHIVPRQSFRTFQRSEFFSSIFSGFLLSDSCRKTLVHSFYWAPSKIGGSFEARCWSCPANIQSMSVPTLSVMFYGIILLDMVDNMSRLCQAIFIRICASGTELPSMGIAFRLVVGVMSRRFMSPHEFIHVVSSTTRWRPPASRLFCCHCRTQEWGAFEVQEFQQELVFPLPPYRGQGPSRAPRTLIVLCVRTRQRIGGLVSMLSWYSAGLIRLVISRKDIFKDQALLVFFWPLTFAQCEAWPMLFKRLLMGYFRGSSESDIHFQPRRNARGGAWHSNIAMWCASGGQPATGRQKACVCPPWSAELFHVDFFACAILSVCGTHFSALPCRQKLPRSQPKTSSAALTFRSEMFPQCPLGLSPQGHGISLTRRLSNKMSGSERVVWATTDLALITSWLWMKPFCQGHRGNKRYISNFPHP